MDIDHPLESLARLLARAIVAQARRQANQQSAAQVLEHQDGSAPRDPRLKEIQNAPQL